MRYKFHDADRWKRIWSAALRSTARQYGAVMDDATTHIRAGDKALANGQTDLSIDCFARAADLAPKNADALRGLAIALVASAAEQKSGVEANRRHLRAAKTCRRILAICPDDQTARFNLGLALMRSASHTEAGEIFRGLLDSEQFGMEAAFNLATVLASQGKLKQAENQLRRLIRENRSMPPSDLAAAHTQLAEVLVDLGDGEGALKAYTEAARLAPKDVAAWLNLATAARACGSYGYAVTATRNAAKLSPFNAEIRLRLGNLLLELHRATGRERFLTEAIDAWRSSLKIDPSQTTLRKRVEVYAGWSARTRPASAPAGKSPGPGR